MRQKLVLGSIFGQGGECGGWGDCEGCGGGYNGILFEMSELGRGIQNEN